MAFNREKAKAAGYTDEQIDSFLKAREFADPQVEKEEQGGLFGGILKSVARPFTETAKRIGEAGYQTYLTALPGSPTEQGSAEQQARLRRSTTFIPEERLGRGEILEDTARSTAGLGAYAAPFAKLPFLGAIGKGAIAGGGLTAAQPEIGAGEIAGGAVLGGLTVGTFKYLPKALRPFKTVGAQREAAAQAATKTVSGDTIISQLESKAQTLSPTQKTSYARFLEAAKENYVGKEISVSDSLNILSEANKAFTAAGKVGKSATASFNKSLGDAIRKELAEKAPDVAKANKLFEKLYKAQGAGKFVARQAAPIAIGATLGKLLFGR